jgi:trk system potassium uptake protein TrkA
MTDGIVHSMLTGLGARVPHRGEVIVIGLGRFGSSLARTLVGMGIEVLGVDADADRVAAMADVLTHVVQADSTSERALRQIGAGDAVTVAVCIGTDVEASVLTAAVLDDLNVPNIWAKAITEAHGRILQRVGAHHVVFPEADMGDRVAHLLTGRMLDYVALDANFVLAEVYAPDVLVGVPLGESNLRAKYKVTVVCVKPQGGQFTYADRGTVLAPTDLIVIAGHRTDVGRFTGT